MVPAGYSVWKALVLLFLPKEFSEQLKVRLMRNLLRYGPGQTVSSWTLFKLYFWALLNHVFSLLRTVTNYHTLGLF